MIRRTIQQMKMRNRLGMLLTLCLILLTGTGAAFSCFGWIDSIRIGIGVSAAVLLATVSGAIVSVVKSVRRESALTRELEQAIYRKRMFIVDSAIEFEEKGIYPESVRSIEAELRFLPEWKAFNVSQSRMFLRRMAFSGAAALIALIVALLCIQPFFERTESIIRFTTYKSVLRLPDYYLPGKPLTLDLSSESAQFDDLAIQIGDRILVSENGMFTLDAELTMQKRLIVRIEATKFGIERTILTHEMVASERFFPVSIGMRIIYPYKTEEYNGLQDTEVWQGGRIELEGSFTKPTRSVDLIRIGDASAVGASISNTVFQIGWTAETVNRYALKAMAVDGDSFSSPEFSVKTMFNQPPTVRIVFPTEDVTVREFRWSVESVVETEDDQGATQLEIRTTVTNCDTSLQYKQVASRKLPIEMERYLKTQMVFDSQNISLLPNDTAAIEFTALDAFGKHSKKATFYIHCPDVTETMDDDAEVRDEMAESLEDLTNAYSDLEESIQKSDVSAAMSAQDKLEQEMEDIAAAQDYFMDGKAERNIEDAEKTLLKMQELVESLTTKTEVLERMAEAMKNNPKAAAKADWKQMDLKQTAAQLSALLKSLEQFQKMSDLSMKRNQLEQTYEKLRTARDENEFDRTMLSFHKQLKDLKRDASERIAEIADKIEKSSQAIRQDDPMSFMDTDELMTELNEAVDEEIRKSGEERLKDQTAKIDAAIDELYLDEMLFYRCLQLDLGDFFTANVAGIRELAENLNAIHSSLMKTEAEIAKTIESLLFASGGPDELIKLMAENQNNIEWLLTSLRDNETETVRDGLTVSLRMTGKVILQLIRLRTAMKDAQSQTQQSAGQSGSISMKDLMNMQAGMSKGLEQMMQKLAQEGKLTPQIQEMMQKLAQIQKQIAEKMQELMKEGDDGLMSGMGDAKDMMEDIVRDLESYKVNDSTIEKSKQLEEKMLKSQKAIHSKGMSEKREAERAKGYDVKSPKSAVPAKREKVDLNEIRFSEMSEYYLRLIDKYRAKNPFEASKSP